MKRLMAGSMGHGEVGIAKRISNSSLFVLVLTAVLICEARADETANETAPRESPITDLDRDHWSFRPLNRLPVPHVKAVDWPRNPIDRFILARIEKEGLAPAPEADQATLIRRLTFDLTGLPPTPAEIDDYVEASSRHPQSAFRNLVDRLLASPAYGERWAQHWLDLARFAETDGFEHDKVRPDAWRYRDWVIDALNRDMPYDRFVQLQLAVDEIAPGDADAARATAFCLSGPDMPDINSQEERRSNLLNEMTGTVGAVFLGLQMGCAQCHDHMYDPISQADFYRLRAIFEPAVNVSSGKSVGVLNESPNKTKPSFLLIRGDWRRHGPEVQPAFPRIANPSGAEIAPADAKTKSSQRRLALAEWLTSADNPLTARVIVNRLWQHHFGEGLSRTPSDFGTIGDEPDHPELLDWLATELIRSGWSLKHLHRLIVTSATYRQASCTSDPADPDNRFLAHMNRRRLEGEAIRDAMLSVAGLLNRDAGGPSVRPPLPKEVVATLLSSSHWQVSPNEADHYRRSIYVFVRRNLHFPLFAAFDRPDGNASCARRSRSTTAPQSLVLLNSEFSLLAAEHLAAFVLAHAPPDLDSRIALLYRRALGRNPQPDEVGRCKQFFELQTQANRSEALPPLSPALLRALPRMVDDVEAVAFADLCLAIINLNEFIYVD